MPLPPAAPRTHRHIRTISLNGYQREDGWIDVEGHLLDQKTYSFDSDLRGHVPALTPLHDMWLRLTLDESMCVRHVDAVIDASPHQICPTITHAFKKLTGEKVKAGWNQRVRHLLGGVTGCTHLVELLGPLATLAYQTLGATQAQERANTEHDPARLPARINSCHAFAQHGPIVKLRWPEHYNGPQDDQTQK
jgi:hypothetical protein